MPRGFTLIELLYALVVASLVLAIGAPTFTNAIKNRTMNGAVNEMVASLQLARSEAIKRRLPVSVCKSTDPAAERPGCSTGGGWESGWLVFVDDDGNGARAGTEDILRQQRAAGGSVVISTPSDQPMQDFLTYLPSGFPNMGSLDAAGVLLFCDDRESNKTGRIINIPQTGRPMATPVSERTDLQVTCQ